MLFALQIPQFHWLALTLVIVVKLPFLGFPIGRLTSIGDDYQLLLKTQHIWPARQGTATRLNADHSGEGQASNRNGQKAGSHPKADSNCLNMIFQESGSMVRWVSLTRCQVIHELSTLVTFRNIQRRIQQNNAIAHYVLCFYECPTQSLCFIAKRVNALGKFECRDSRCWIPVLP
jgi:hypothetical protein